jgi:hypothetical protein
MICLCIFTTLLWFEPIFSKELLNIMSESLLQPNESLKVAIVGTGKRTRNMYVPLIPSLKPWIEVVAVCDPVKEHADELAAALGVPAYYDIHQLVKDRPMEAALVVTPIESHHSISVYLSSNGIHNLTETAWCSMLSQARQMIDTARNHSVIVRVAENFFRFPVDRFSQRLKESGYIGEIHRIFSYNDHTGYHNNSRWIRFAEAHPLWVQAVYHTMKTGEFHSTPQRFHTDESFRSHYYGFPDNLLVIDQAANIKGFLGRQTRPGYNEWQGEYGTLVHRGAVSTQAPATYYRDGEVNSPGRIPLRSETELRFCSPESLAQYGSHADHISEVINEYDGHNWIRIYAETSQGLIEYRNPLMTEQPSKHRLNEYSAGIMGQGLVKVDIKK